MFFCSLWKKISRLLVISYVKLILQSMYVIEAIAFNVQVQEPIDYCQANPEVTVEHKTFLTEVVNSVICTLADLTLVLWKHFWRTYWSHNLFRWRSRASEVYSFWFNSCWTRTFVLHYVTRVATQAKSVTDAIHSRLLLDRRKHLALASEPTFESLDWEHDF